MPGSPCYTSVDGGVKALSPTEVKFEEQLGSRSPTGPPEMMTITSREILPSREACLELRTN